MDLIARNPYRIIGVFANDTNKVRTANTGKIRAFLKVGKEVHFDIDAPNLFGSLNRTQEMLDNAISLLSDETEAAIQALFWFHSDNAYTTSLMEVLSDAESPAGNEAPERNAVSMYLKSIRKSKVGKTKGPGIPLSYAELLNAAIISLATEDYASAADYYFLVIDADFQEFRKAVNFLPPPQGSTSNKQFVQLFIERLTAEYPNVDWWQHFSCSGKRTVPHHLKDIFEKVAIDKIKENIDHAKKEKPAKATEWLRIVQRLRRSCFPHIKALQPYEKNTISADGQVELNFTQNTQPHGGNTVSAEGQLVLDELCKELIRECRLYYKVAKSDNEESVLPTLQIVDYALSLASSNDVKEKAAAFKKELDQDVQKLPPQKVKEEARNINNEIKAFCWKPDEIQWSIQLVKNCFPYLKAIKEKLGRDNAYYIAISTRIADNAMYNSVNELKRAEQSYKASQHTETDRLKLVNSLRKAWELLLYFQQMRFSMKFSKGKLHAHVDAVQQKLRQYNVKYSDITISESLLTEEEAFLNCDNLSTLIKLSKQYPNSRFYAATNERIRRKDLESFLSTTPKPILFEDPISSTFSSTSADTSLYLSCKSKEDYEEYLRKYPNGCFAKEAKDKLQSKVDARIIAIIIWIAGISIAGLSNAISCSHSEGAKESVASEIVEETIAPDDKISSDEVENAEEYSSSNTTSTYDSLIEARQKEVEEWGENHLSTGSAPYRSFFGNARTGDNYLKFETKGDCDYVIIVKRASDDRYMNHIYIKGGDKATLYLPDGYYNVYFYSGKGWNPNKKKGSLTGGFVSMESQQKDVSIDFVSYRGWEYTLYPVQDGNLKLTEANEDEIFGE